MEEQSLRSAAAHEFAVGLNDLALTFQAKNYAVNALILRKISVLFAMFQKGAPLTEEEIKAEIDLHSREISTADAAILESLDRRRTNIIDEIVQQAVLRMSPTDSGPAQ